MAQEKYGDENWEKARDTVSSVNPWFGIFHTVGKTGEGVVSKMFGGGRTGYLMGKMFFDPIGGLMELTGSKGGLKPKSKQQLAYEEQEWNKKLIGYQTQQIQSYQDAGLRLDEMTRQYEEESRKSQNMLIFGIVGGVVVVGGILAIVIAKNRN
jgi:hypothetical protein